MSFIIKVPIVGKMYIRKYFPATVNIYAKRHDSVLKIDDRCGRRFDKLSGIEYYTLLRSKGEFKPVPYRFIYQSDTGAPHINLWSPASGQYFPMEIKEDEVEVEREIIKIVNNRVTTEMVTIREPAIKPVDESIMQTANVSHRKVDIIYKDRESQWTKFLPIMMLMTMGIVMFGILLFYPAFFTQMVDTMNSLTGRLEAVVDKVGLVSQVANTAPPPG